MLAVSLKQTCSQIQPSANSVAALINSLGILSIKNNLNLCQDHKLLKC